MLTTDKLIPIVDTAKAGYSLPQALYCQEDAFSQDMARVIKQKWLLVDHLPHSEARTIFSVRSRPGIDHCDSRERRHGECFLQCVPPSRLAAVSGARKRARH